MGACLDGLYAALTWMTPGHSPALRIKEPTVSKQSELEQLAAESQRLNGGEPVLLSSDGQHRYQFQHEREVIHGIDNAIAYLDSWIRSCTYY